MTGKAERQLPPRETWVPRMFHRDGQFYVIDLPPDEDLSEHVTLNPGTLMITDAITGAVLWRLQ